MRGLVRSKQDYVPPEIFYDIRRDISKLGVRAEYVPSNKEASVIWRQRDEEGKNVRDFELRSLFLLQMERKEI